MDLKKLDNSFYIDNPVLYEALDFDNNTHTWLLHDNKVRGHGIVQIQISEQLIFAIPVRSRINHNQCYILELNREKNKRFKGMGLDYSKALLIRDSCHISDKFFLLKSKDAGKKLAGKEAHVTKQFTQYVNKYINAVNINDANVLNSLEYRFTTLKNYHKELNCGN